MLVEAIIDLINAHKEGVSQEVNDATYKLIRAIYGESRASYFLYDVCSKGDKYYLSTTDDVDNVINKVIGRKGW